MSGPRMGPSEALEPQTAMARGIATPSNMSAMLTPTVLMAGEPARPDRLLRQSGWATAGAQAKHQEARQVTDAGRSRQQADVDEEAGDVDVPPADGGLHGDWREDHRRDAVAEHEERQAERRLRHRCAELVLEQHQARRVDLREVSARLEMKSVTAEAM